MGKVLLWTVVILGAMMLTRILTHHQAAKTKRPTARKPARPATANRNAEPEPMVRCEHCGIHLPRSEAVLSGGQTWCCTEHARLGPGAQR